MQKRKDLTDYERAFNFSAGPAVLPVSVLERARDEMLNFEGSGMSILEMSHRSKEFDKVIERAEQGIRRNLGVSDRYAVLFLQGGASLQFAMVPMNLYSEGKPIDVLNTGVWTKKALAEIKKLAPSRVIASGESDNFLKLPARDKIQRNGDASYVHMASNNTIFGTQWQSFPEFGEVPLVADMSSDIFSRVIDVSKFGLIFAGAQKNMGPAGVTVVIIRKDLAERARKELPTMLQYRAHIEEGSRYNTPPTFGIYIVGLVMDWVVEQGGVQVLERRNKEKAKLLYDALDASSYFYCPVEKSDRSNMNVVFRLRKPDELLEKKFLEESKKAGLYELKGHRSVGGFRASIYNAMPVEGIQALNDFLKDFERKNG